LFANNAAEQSEQGHGDEEETRQASPRFTGCSLLPGMDEIVIVPSIFT
jgi:hypothetical protein